ncbi:MAG: PIG-L family deacetylase [bacterium]
MRTFYRRICQMAVKSLCLTISISLVTSFIAYAQPPQQMSSGEILHGMKKLSVLGSVLYVAAHPDDENTRFLAYMARVRQYRTGYLSMTRGDGGQNLIGEEQGVELGLIRTQELLAARRVDGAEQFFTRAYDFGYSKSTEEALTLWDKEKILSDAVWVIRNFRPDIIVTRFPEDNRAGHGHHSASAVIAREAFIAAGDPTRFPEQFKYGVGPWKAKRILWNTYSFGSSNTTSEDQQKIDLGAYLPLLGKSIGELSAEGRSKHRSQGFGSASSRGSSMEYFLHTMGDKAQKDLMDGIADNWQRIEGGSLIAAKINALIADFNMNDPSASLPALVEIRKLLSGVKDEYWKKIKVEEVDKLIQMSAGIYFEALSDRQLVKQGDSLKLNLAIINRSTALVELDALEVNEKKIDVDVTLKQNINWISSFAIPAPPTVSQPYWLVNDMNKANFNVNDQLLIGLAENKPSFIVKASIKVEGSTIQYEFPVSFRVVDPAKGEFFHRVSVVPAQTVAAPPTPILIIHAESASDNSKHKETAGNKTVLPVLRKIDYEHIPSIVYFKKGDQLVISTDIKTTGKKIGYIVGAGDKVAEMIKLMGYEVTELGKSDIYEDKLAQFDAIVLGVRAYNVHDWLTQKNEILMDYVRNGGNMVVQYNTNNYFGPLSTGIGPKPFNINRGRITNEDADVVILDDTDPVMSYPNKISSSDFSGWIQERGIYFADGYEKDYKPLLAMHDKGEGDLKGSLIVCKEGKGRFIYTGLVFFRQLPAGVPGAFRLFANLISNPNLTVNGSK